MLKSGPRMAIEQILLTNVKDKKSDGINRCEFMKIVYGKMSEEGKSYPWSHMEIKYGLGRWTKMKIGWTAKFSVQNWVES